MRQRLWPAYWSWENRHLRPSIRSFSGEGAQAGYFYPSTGRNPDGVHNLLFPLKGDTYNAPQMQALMASVAEIEAHSSGRPVILSSETLCAAPMAKVTALHALFDPFDTRIVYYIRPQVPLVESAFRQFQRARLSPRHTAIRDVAAYFKARQDGFDFEKNLAPWEAVFGTAAISVRLYDRRTGSFHWGRSRAHHPRRVLRKQCADCGSVSECAAGRVSCRGIKGFAA